MFDKIASRARAAAHAIPTADLTAAKPASVTEFTVTLKARLEREFHGVFIEGEISNLRPAASGHVYFVLKDERAAVSCVLWANESAALTQPLHEGDQVELRGRLTVYEPRGQYQIVVSSVRPAGLGRLHAAFLRLKEKLAREGLFDPSRKLPIPRVPRRVGIVTSPTGAAIRDILNVMQRRAPQVEITLYPARVQGEQAAAEIARAIRRFNELALADVLIVGRGGGSIEDLWPFNEEIVARAIADSRIPIISAVGHETDFTIADFVADLRAPTPSAAAEIVASHRGELIETLRHLRLRMNATMEQRLIPLRQAPHLSTRLIAAVRRKTSQLEHAARLDPLLLAAVRNLYARRRADLRGFDIVADGRLPLKKVNELRQRADDLAARLPRAAAGNHALLRAGLERLSAQLSALNPTAILERGYSIVFDRATGAVVKSVRQARPGRRVTLQMADGEALARIEPSPAATPNRAPAAEWFGEPSEPNS